MSAPDDWEPDRVEWLGSAYEGQIVPLTRPELDEWIHRVQDGVRDCGRGGSATTRNPRTRLAVEERWFNDGTADRVRLQFIPTNEGVAVALVTRDGGDADAEQAWRDIVTAATGGIGERVTTTWTATLCELSSQLSAGTTGIRLAEPITAAELTLESWPHCISEERRAWFPGMGYRPFPHGVWPLRVNGTVDTYDWDEDGIDQAAARVRELLEVLSLAWNIPFEIRVGPYRDPDALVAGDEDRLIPGITGDEIPEDHALRVERRTDLPNWVADWLTNHAKSSKVARALAAHHEGLTLMARHPSLALISFVGAIEALAVSEKGRPRCPECEKPIEGLAAQFREAVATVLDDEEATLLGDAYTLRSRTAHGARLLGSEVVLGKFPAIKRFPRTDHVRFEAGTVRIAATASRRLLLQAIELN